IEALLGRAPTFAELGVFSALWSEHCSYKHSRPILKTFPTAGPQVVQGPGENAGVLRLPGGWAVAFKIESHNHPSAVEPYQGAAPAAGPGGRPVHRETAAGSEPRADRLGPHRGDPGYGRRGADVLVGRDGRAGRCRGGDRPVARAHARAWDDPVRDPALRVAGTDGGRRAG